jgi:hypothetical protein
VVPIGIVSTAAGPNKDAMTAAAVSVVLRHEQDLVFEFDVVWCSGQVRPSPWEQVHRAPTTALGIPAHSALGVTVSTASWDSNQPPANHAK